MASAVASPEKLDLASEWQLDLENLKWDIELGRQVKSRSIISSVLLKHGSFYRTAGWVKQINFLGATEEVFAQPFLRSPALAVS